MKILVVDDSRIIRNVLKNILAEKGIKEDAIIEAADGAEALNILMNNKIDLILLDWNMPKLNGLELLKVARNMPNYKNTPIVMVTSEAAKYNVMEAIKAGVTDYVIKPVSAKNILPKIEKFLK
jgi:two-component system chemotaxis response regulator CheY